MSGSPSADPGGDDVAADPRVGSVLADRYRIDSLLGEGGMGRVYAAEHVLMRKRLAIKILHRELTTVPDVVARFEREAMAAANIEHPNVAAATDFGKLPDGSVFLVLEFVQGKNLRDEIAEGPMPVERALHITRQMASALAAAHALDIVHRDLKPENVMLVNKGGDPDFAKVLDFGIAKVPIGEAGTTGKAITKVGMVFGTPEYMAPEQALGQPVDGRADLYALGVIVYEMLAGVRPFSSKSAVGILGQQLSKDPPPFSERAQGLVIPPAVERLVMRLLAKEAGERFQTASDVVNALSELLGPTPGRGGHMFTMPGGTVAGGRPSSPSFHSIPDLEAPLPQPELISVPDLPAPPMSGSAPDWEVPDEALSSHPRASFPSDPRASYPSDPRASVPSYPEPQSSPGLAIPPSSVGTLPGGVLPPSSVAATSSALASGPHPRVELPSGAGLTKKDPLGSAKELLEKVYDFIDDQRDKLPPGVRRPLKGVPTPAFLIAAVVLALGAVLGVVLLVVALAAGSSTTGPVASASGGPSPSGSAPTPKVPKPSAVELAQARQGGSVALSALATKFPKDTSLLLELTKAQIAERRHGAAALTVSKALSLDPKLSTNPEVASALWALAQTKDGGEAAFQLLEGPMGAKGADIMYDLATTAGIRATVKQRANTWLKSEQFQKNSSPELNILAALTLAKSCSQRHALLLRARNVGDARTLKLLQSWKKSKAGCGRRGRDDCHPCLRTDGRLDEAIAAIEKRMQG